jgi:hypothetical protein
MPKAGDRIAVLAGKGAPARHGKVLDEVGRMLVVEWDDGHRSSFFPAPGGVVVESEAEAASGRP